MIEVKDEILNGEPLYRIKDNQGNILHDNITIEMITQLIQAGTPINKVLFDSIKEDIFEYKEPIYTFKPTVSYLENYVPKLNSNNESGFEITSTAYVANNAFYKLFDGSVSVEFARDEYLQIKLKESVNIKKIKFTVSTSTTTSGNVFSFWGSIDGTNWVKIATSNSTMTAHEVNVNVNMYFKYFKVSCYTSSASGTAKLSILNIDCNYVQDDMPNKFDLKLNLMELKKGTSIHIKLPDDIALEHDTYIQIDNFGYKKIIGACVGNAEYVYDGEKFTKKALSSLTGSYTGNNSPIFYIETHCKPIFVIIFPHSKSIYGTPLVGFLMEGKAYTLSSTDIKTTAVFSNSGFGIFSDETNVFGNICNESGIIYKYIVFY